MLTTIHPVTREDAVLLATQSPLSDLLAAATELRAQGKGSVITFSKKVFIPLTTLCRDYCSDCTFRKDPGQPGAHFMTPDEVLALAERGRQAGCKEALFSLGDQPEKIFLEAREFLRMQGYSRTLDYLAAMCEFVLDKTGLLSHANPGVMDIPVLARLKDSNASVGLMLENVSPRLMRDGLPHAKAPDKVPALCLRTIEEAVKLSIAFTTEIPMAAHPEPSLEDMLRTIAIARLILGPHMNIQAPPNLSYDDFPRLLEAGINDWGGISPVTRDFINPEAAWPQIDRLQSETESRGFTLRERLALYPEFVHLHEFLSPRVRDRITEVAGPDGFARDAAYAAGI